MAIWSSDSSREVLTGSPPVEYTGGWPDPASSQVVRWILGLAILVLALATAFGLAAGMSRESPREPEAASLFVRAAERGDGATMRRYVTPHCLQDPNSSLCFDAENDANWAALVKNSHPRFTFSGIAGDLIVYHVSDDQGSSIDVAFRMDPKTGLIDSQRTV